MTDDLRQLADDVEAFDQIPGRVTEEELKTMAVRYCIEGAKMSEVEEEFDLAHTEFLSIRRAFRFRKGEPVVLDPDATAEEAAGQIASAERRHSIERKAKQKAAREERKAARKWWSLEESLQEAAEQFSAPTLSMPPERLELSGEPCGLLFAANDLHYGKYASELEVGERYDRSVARKRALEATEAVLSRACRIGAPERIWAVVGTSDWLHIDRDDSGPTTHAGTPQDADGTMGEILAGGQELAVEVVEELRQVAPVTLVYCEGNHDRVLGKAVHSFLHAWYREAPDVEVPLDFRARQYTTYGNNTVLWYHGEGRKSQLKQLGTIIAKECRWSENVMAISGHKHFRQSDDLAGVQLRQTLSLSGSDRWHHRNLYSSKAGLQAHLLSPADGEIATLTHYVS